MAFHMLDGKMFHFHGAVLSPAMGKLDGKDPQVGLADAHQSVAFDRSSALEKWVENDGEGWVKNMMFG